MIHEGTEPDALMFPSFQLSVVASQRGATKGMHAEVPSQNHPNSQSTYVEVQYPVPAWLTQINVGERISQAVLANCIPAADIGIMADAARTAFDSADTLFWFQSLLRRRHKCS